MPDEACSHWYSVLQSLTEGQKWLKTNFNVTPVSSWSIDPFGYSATFAYILKKSGFENLLIQRTHYSVKKYFAQKRDLEFRWSQMWDTKGETELFTHMMPFYSYDVPHTCGPDPKVCCQFDFKRLPGYGITCPWKVQPQQITDDNVAKRADLIVDQWRKKSKLYKTRAVLIPLGDDFRYTQSMEWEAQRVNFEKLFEHINNDPHLHVEAKFATLQEYFDAVKAEKSPDEFSTLSGDFFTYADRDDHYWSGYFTSRPYYKRMDRILMNFLRSAEMLHSWHPWDGSFGLEKRLEIARRALSIFQHHDGVSGTAKDYVMKDYDSMMVEGIKNCKFVMQQAVYRLLTQSNVYIADPSYTYFNMDDSRSAGNDDSRSVIIIGDEVPFKYVVVHNSLPHERTELVEFVIAKPFVTVTDPEGNVINAQVTPSWTWHQSVYGRFLNCFSLMNTFMFTQLEPTCLQVFLLILGTISPQASTTKYKLMFVATVPPLGLTVYKITAKTSKEDSTGTTYAKVTIFTDAPFSIANLDEYPEKIEFAEHREVSLRLDDASPGASFNKYGMLKSLSQEGVTVPVHLEFLKYGTRSVIGQKSGAYLFIPDGTATPLSIGTPTVLLSKGELQQDLSAGLPFAVHENILRSGESLEIRNLVDIGDRGNTEIVMRLSTNIKSNKTFYTDLNGMQMVKRERFSKIPLQANYYPISNAIFIEDNIWRMTLFTGLPLGGSSLKSGEIEIMQDRRLNQDDERGMGQGVLDNRAVLNICKLVLESRESCKVLNENYPSGFLTPYSYEEQKRLMHPIDKLIFSENDWKGVVLQFGENHEGVESGIEIVTLRSLPAIPLSPTGIVLHRTNFGECAADKAYDGIVNVRRMLGFDDDAAVFNSHVTLLSKRSKVEDETIALCPMDLKGLIIRKT